MSFHVPQRTCAGCGGLFAKRDLLRIARSPSGELSLDLSGRKPGRGYYLCRQPQCLEKAMKSKSLERKIGSHLCDELVQQLRQAMESRQEVESCQKRESTN